MSFQAAANPHLIELHLGLNECATCYGAIANFSSLHSYKKVIVISRRDSAAASEFLSNYGIPADVQFRYGTEKILGASYCLVFNHDQKVDSFEFRSLPRKMPELEALTLKEKRVKLPPSVVLNVSRLVTSASKQNVAFFDYALNKVVILKFDSKFDSVQQITEIKGANMDRREFLSKGHLDSNMFNAVFPGLKKFGKSDPHIETMFANDTVVSLLINFPNASVSPRSINDTVVGFAFFIYDMNLVTGKSRLTFVNQDAFMNEFHQKYFVRNGRPIFWTKAGLHMTLSDFSDIDQNYRFLSVWKPVNNLYEFEKFDNVSLNLNYYKDNKIANYVTYVNRDFYFNTMLSVIVDVQSDKLLNEKPFRILEKGQFAQDMIRKGNHIQALICDNYTSAGVWKFDGAGRSLVAKKQLELPGDCEYLTMKFLPDCRSVICLDNIGKTLIKVDVPED